MKRTLKRGLKVLEIVNREANRTGKDGKKNQSLGGGFDCWVRIKPIEQSSILSDDAHLLFISRHRSLVVRRDCNGDE